MEQYNSLKYKALNITLQSKKVITQSETDVVSAGKHTTRVMRGKTISFVLAGDWLQKTRSLLWLVGARCKIARSTEQNCSPDVRSIWMWRTNHMQLAMLKRLLTGLLRLIWKMVKPHKLTVYNWGKPRRDNNNSVVEGFNFLPWLSQNNRSSCWYDPNSSIFGPFPYRVTNDWSMVSAELPLSSIISHRAPYSIRSCVKGPDSSPLRTSKRRVSIIK